MLVLIEAELGKITLDVSFAAYMGASEMNWSSEQYEIKLCDKNSISFSLLMQMHKDKETILPIGSVEFVRKAAALMGVELPLPLNIPHSLSAGLGRETWISKRSKLVNFPCFVKPAEEVQLFPGFVAKSEKDFYLYPELQQWDGLLFCSEPLPEIISEWRCYILNGKVFNCSCYAGNPLIFPVKEEVEHLIARYKDAPIGYSLDVAVTTRYTELIECNDAWSLGYYGGNFVDYFKMVKARWLEILKENDAI